MIDRRVFVAGGVSVLSAALAGCGGGGDPAEEPGVPMVAQMGPSAAGGSRNVQFVVQPLLHTLLVTGADGVRRKAGGLGRGPGQLNFPIDVASLGDLAYVVETGNHRVQAFDAQGESWGSFGQDVLFYPGGIEIRRSEILVADSRNGRIVGFEPGGKVTRILGAGVLSAPRGLAVEGEDLLVADPGLRKVVRIDGEGRVREEIGGDWVLPWSVATDGKQVFVTDVSESAVSVVEMSSGRKRRVAVPKPPRSVKSRKGALHLA